MQAASKHTRGAPAQWQLPPQPQQLCWGLGPQGKIEIQENIWEVAPICQALLGPNGKGLQKERLLPCLPPNLGIFSHPFPSRREGASGPQYRQSHHQRAQTINYPPSWRRLAFNFPDYHKD